jgi:HEAT repeats
MKSALTLTVILSLVAATAKAHADEGKDQLVKLRAQLKSSDAKTRAAAATELSWVEEGAAVGLLVKALASDPSAHVRQAAAQEEETGDESKNDDGRPRGAIPRGDRLQRRAGHPDKA